MFRKRLSDHVIHLRSELERREEALVAEYTRRSVDFARRVERLEMGPKRRAKEARNREFFEKVRWYYLHAALTAWSLILGFCTPNEKIRTIIGCLFVGPSVTAYFTRIS